MNDYMIRKPYSKKKGDAYLKIEIQKYEYNKTKQRSDRKGKMMSLRIDIDSTSSLTQKDLYDQIYEFLKLNAYVC